MAVRPPGKDDLAAIARGYGMHLSDEDLGSFEPMVAGLLTSYDAVEELYAQTAPQSPANRTWKQPGPDELGKPVPILHFPRATDHVAAPEVLEIIRERGECLHDVVDVGDVFLPFGLLALASRQLIEIDPRRHAEDAARDAPAARSLAPEPD